MKSRLYGERDYAFGQAMLTLRTAAGLTQAGLADLVGISRQAVVGWEAGSSYPQAKHLKQFLALCVKQQAFAPGREADEIRAFWKAAHQKVLLDEHWLAALLAHPRPAAMPGATGTMADAGAQPAPGPRVDWGDVLAVTSFYGREAELATVTQWILKDHCRVVTVLGLGGIGKSALVVSLMYRLTEDFEVIMWRSLRDAPPCEAFLDKCLEVLAPHSAGEALDGIQRRINLLMQHLVSRRVLLVIDNIETLLEDNAGAGYWRSGYEGYGQLLARVADSEHQSCLLLTSREKPRDLIAQEGNRCPVRALRLAGLETAACEQIFSERGVVGSAQDQQQLIEWYGGNPLALKIVAHTIVELFGGEIASFLKQGAVVFGGVRELLAKQFDRLSPTEQSTFLWLAILREPVTLDELLAVEGLPLPRVQVLEAVESLRRRSLIEPGKLPGSFTLQSVLLEYATARLIDDATREIERGHLVRLIEHGLELATAREYIRQVNERLFLVPILERLRGAYPEPNAVEEHLITLLDQLRQRSRYTHGYGPANMLGLLRLLRGDLRGLDFSQLLIRGAYLQGVEMQDANLAEATLQDTVFTETFDLITAVATSPKGRYWAAASMRGEVRVWREGGHTLHRIWQAHTGQVRTITFGPDDCTLATGSHDGTLKLWDLEEGTLLWTGWHTGNVNRVTFAPDGRALASGGDDGIIRFWDVRRGTLTRTLATPGGPIYGLAWSPDGSLLASGGFDTQIRLWEMQEAQPGTDVRMLTGHTNWVVGLAFAPDGRTLASSSWDWTVKLWDLDSLRVDETLAGHTNLLFGVAWSPDGRLLASCGVDQTIRLWDVEQAIWRTVLHGHTGAVNGIAFTPDSRSLLSGSDDATLRVWDVERGQCTRVVQSYSASCNDVDWSPDGDRLACAGADTWVTLWDVAGRTPSRVLRGHSWSVDGVAWSPDGRLLASSGWDNAVRVWDASTGACVRTLRDPDHVDTVFLGIGWSPDGKLLATGSFERGVQVWEVSTGARRWVSLAQPTMTRRVAWSPDGTHLASGSGDGSVCVWESSDGTQLAKLEGHQGMVMSVAWSPDGARLASGGGRGSGELFIWDARSGERLYTLNEPTAIVHALAFDPSGTQLLIGGSDGVLRWWALESRKCWRERPGHQGAVQSLKISPDGRRLASCGIDGAVMLWDLESGEKLGTLRRDRPYERLDISGVQGLTEAQRATLRAQGAVEDPGASVP